MAYGSQPRWTDRSAATQLDIDVGLRDYMLRIYNYMASALALTGIVAYVFANSGMCMSIARTPAIWLVMLAPLGLVMLLSFGINKLGATAAQGIFWLYAGLMGISLSSVFLVFSRQRCARVLYYRRDLRGDGLYGYTTKRDLTQLGSFLFMGLIGIVIAMLVNVFIQSSAIQFAISVIGVLVFTGLTAWPRSGQGDVFRGRRRGDRQQEGGDGRAAACLDFVNLFMMLIQLLGVRRD